MMKNLYITEGRSIEFGVDVIGNCLDLDNRTLYVLASDLSLFSTKTGDVRVTRIDYKLDKMKLTSSNLHKDDVILIEFIVEDRSIVIVLQNGQIIQISLLSDEPHARLLYQHPTSLSSVRYSPNQDLIALADCNNELTMMTPSYESIGSTNALEENNSAHKPVGVGWGSKETQFFGLDGRPSKEKQAKDRVTLDVSELKAIDQIEGSPIFQEFRAPYQKSTVIDWRGDGHFLATLTFLPETSKHYLKVWNRNLELQYMSEQLVTVERGIISWVPNGQYVCLAQRRDQRINEIALFEKNGMVHQRITLPLVDRNLYIQAMSWSTDSKILALLARLFDVDDGQVRCKCILFLYTMQNFHYYLKYSQYMEDCGLNPRWDLVDSRLHLTMTTKPGYYVSLDCRFCVDSAKEFSTVTVVDGNRLLVTPMDLCNVPPPMSALEVVLPDLIRKLAVCPRNSKTLFVLTLSGELLFHHEKLVASDEKQVELRLCMESASDLRGLENIRTMEVGELAHNLHHLTCITLAGTSYLIAVHRTTGINQLVLIEPITKTNKALYNLGDRHVISIAQFVSEQEDKQLALLFNDQTVEFFDLESRQMITKQCLFTADAIRLCSGIIDSQVVEIRKVKHLITLNSELVLRFDNRIISSSCTSFRTTEHYLLYTATDNHIYLTLLGRLDSAQDVTDVESWSQTIENGGTLIAASEQSSKIVLQMPRGNLEILHLRIFIFTLLTNLLSLGKYVEAIKLARRHRVNLNFLCDYLIRLADGPFLITKFAATIAEDDPALLNLFLTELEETDTIVDRYKSIMKHLPDSCSIPTLDKSPLESDKVNKICSNILLSENPKYLQPRLLCLLTYKPARTTEALKIVHDLPKDLKENCLRFVIYFVDIEQLFIESIRTYDTDIALMVAGASNKDPKEYLALLDGFNATENINMRRHMMDLHVGNYESAFDNLLEYCNNLADKSEVEFKLVELVSTKRIYKHATSVLNKRPNFTNLTRHIWSRYADYLLEKKYYLEAGVAFSKASALSDKSEYLSNALKCFSLANNFENSLALIARSDVDGKLKAEHRSKISAQLFERGKNFDAIAVMCDIPKNVLDNRAFDMVNQGDWYLAEYFSSDDARPRIHGANLMAILEHCDTNLQSVTEYYRSAKTHFERLLKLLQDYQESKFNNPDFDNLADSLSTVDGSEVSSLDASAINNSGNAPPRSGAPSLKTRTSSKSNRSQAVNKKRINLKQGSRHEDLALVLELQKFVSSLGSLQEQNIKTSAALYTYCDLNLARERNESMNQILKECYSFAKEMVETLWPNTTQLEDAHSLYRRFNANVLFSPENQVDNVDLQVLMRPELPKGLTTFEL